MFYIQQKYFQRILVLQRFLNFSCPWRLESGCPSLGLLAHAQQDLPVAIAFVFVGLVSGAPSGEAHVVIWLQQEC